MNQQSFYNSNKGQLQLQKGKQTQSQAIDQAMSHRTLNMLLKTAEVFAVGYDGKRDFSKFDITNIRKSQDELRTQFITQIATFQDSYFYIIKTYGEYQLPEDENLQFIQNYVNYWKSLLYDSKDKKLYNDIIDILMGKRNEFIQIPYDDKKMDCDDENKEVQIGNTANFMLAFQHDSLDLENKVKKEFNEKGRYVHKANLADKEKVNKHLCHANMDMKRRVPNQPYGKEIKEGPGNKSYW